MEMSDWRHSIVDLTYDDDDAESDEGALSSLPLATSTPTHSHPSMSAPLPRPASSRPLPPTTRPAPAYVNPYPPPPGNMPKATNTASMRRLGQAPSTYVPVPGQSSNGASDSRAAKRIKTSEGAPKTSTPPVKKPTPRRGIPPAAQAATLGKYKLNAWTAESSAPVPPSSATSKPSAGNANKAPSVQDINKALKTNAAPTLHGVRTVSSRALQIGRRPGSSSGPVKPAPPIRETPRMSQAPSAQNQRQQSGDTATYNGLSAGIPNRSPGRPRSRLPPASNSTPSRPNYFTGPAKEQPSDEDHDSVMSDVSSSADSVPQQPSDEVKSGNVHHGLGPPVATFHSSTLPKGADVPAPPLSTGRKKTVNPFDTAQDHYLIFLKEVKQFTWAQITAEYNNDMPHRPYAALQSRYSTFLNKRDRSHNPSMLILPSRWAAEATVDWNLVRSTSAPSRGPRSNLSASHPHQPKRQEQAPRHLPIQQTIEQDYSSGGDSAPRRERPRRAKPVNYTWPKQRGIPGGGIEEEFTEDSFEAVADDFGYSRSETSPEDDSPLPSKAIAVENQPVDVHFNADDAEIGLSLRRTNSRKDTTKKMPYLSTSQRLSIQNPPAGEWNQLTSRDWQGTLLHVDFSPAEIASVEKAIASTKRTSTTRHSTKGRQLREHLKAFTEPQILRLVESLLHRLHCRDRSSIQAFIQDALAGDVAEVLQIQRLAAARPDTEMQSTQRQSTTSIIRQRELGLQSRRGWHSASNPLTYQVKNKYMDTMGPAAHWTGASSDIHTVAWAPDGEHFAAGAVAVDDPDSMQYNRPNNLLFGSTMQGTIHELAEHYRIREKTKTGANSSHAMFASQDPKLYTTVSSVAFSNTSPYMYSSGYDGHIGIWRTDLEATQPMLAAKLNVKDQIDILSVNRTNPSMIATAAKVFSEKAIRVLKIDEAEPWNFAKSSFHSNKAVARADLRILPSALQFEPAFGGLLLAGFGANLKETGLDMTGDLCLWDVETQTPYNIHGSNRNIFDVTFNPNRSNMPLFAAGCVATGSTVNRGTRSTVRLYDVRDDSKLTCPIEFECKALDMNDVIWCPHDERLIAAGCTDGKVYVWDARWPDDPLRVLSHGSSLMPLQEGIKHEITDTGIRFLSWGGNATRLYSGSSDGVVKVWDVTRAEENTFIKDLITTDSGIMSAAFSPDYSKLVVGEVNGSVNVLEVGRDDTTIKDANRLRYMPYQDDEQDDIQDEASDITHLAPESGITEGNYLLQTRQLQVAPMGSLPIRQVVQGVNYAGPFDESIDAPFLREQALQFQLGLTIPRGHQCDIPACKDNLNKVTSEDVGDSGRSEDRIPDELRRQWKAIDTKSAIIPGKSKCTHCGRPARPSTTKNSDVVLCERCSFACFRCGSVNPIAPSSTTLICDSCAGVWDIGVLGYECVQQPYAHNRHMQLDVPALERWGEEAHADRQDDFDTNHGDEMNALTDYYLSLAIDRPESPPL